MSSLKRFLYGLLLGITSIAPGISGGTIAIALGFYEKLIHSIANILSDFKKQFRFLFPFGAGVLISVAALSVILEYFFENFTLPTSALFIGLILGTLPFIRNKLNTSLNDRKVSWRHILTGVIFFIVVLLPVISGEDSTIAQITWNAETGLTSVITYAIIGIIMASTMIIPGLSGTMILMSMGLYQSLLSLASTAVTTAVSFDLPALAALMPQLIPLGLGFLTGALLLAKAINRMFKAIPTYIYSAITGLLCATPVVMLSEIPLAELSLLNIIASCITFAAGLLLVRKLGSEE